jgi:hypothetical protein
MSRGAGRWERVILEAVDASPDGVPMDFLRLNSRTRQVAFMRAVKRLREKSRIELGSDPQGGVILQKPGTCLTAGRPLEYKVMRTPRGYQVFAGHRLTDPDKGLSDAECNRLHAELEQIYGAITMVTVDLDNIAFDLDVDAPPAPGPDISDGRSAEVRQEMKVLAPGMKLQEEVLQSGIARPRTGE